MTELTGAMIPVYSPRIVKRARRDVPVRDSWAIGATGLNPCIRDLRMDDVVCWKS